MENNNEIKLGLWSKSSASGKEYFSGSVTIEGKKYWVTMFDRNVNKKNEKQPDYNIFLKPADAVATVTPSNEVDENDGLPF